jgi:hypothetical protein
MKTIFNNPFQPTVDKTALVFSAALARAAERPRCMQIIRIKLPLPMNCKKVLLNVFLGIFLFFLLMRPQISSAENLAAKLIGMKLCEAKNEYSFVGMYVPFDKDPSSYSFGDIQIDTGRYIIVIDNTKEEKCGTIIAAMKVLNKMSKYDSIGFNCVALNQKYDRHKSYIGIFRTNNLEYTSARVAWSFNFATLVFEEYKKANKIYCPNFIAD